MKSRACMNRSRRPSSTAMLLRRQCLLPSLALLAVVSAQGLQADDAYAAAQLAASPPAPPAACVDTSGRIDLRILRDELEHVEGRDKWKWCAIFDLNMVDCIRAFTSGGTLLEPHATFCKWDESKGMCRTSGVQQPVCPGSYHRHGTPWPLPPPPPSQPPLPQKPPPPPGLPPVALIQKLNWRYTNARATGNMALSGVNVKVFSRREKKEPWTKDNMPWMFSGLTDRVATSIVSTALPFSFRGDGYAENRCHDKCREVFVWYHEGDLNFVLLRMAGHCPHAVATQVRTGESYAALDNRPCGGRRCVASCVTAQRYVASPLVNLVTAGPTEIHLRCISAVSPLRSVSLLLITH